MSRHKKRRQRRARYREMLRCELSDELAFTSRVKAVFMNKDGLDIAPDGLPIKADFFGAIQEWEQTDPQAARACLHVIEKVVHPQSARSTVSFIGRAMN